MPSPSPSYAALLVLATVVVLAAVPGESRKLRDQHKTLTATSKPPTTTTTATKFSFSDRPQELRDAYHNAGCWNDFAMDGGRLSLPKGAEIKHANHQHMKETDKHLFFPVNGKQWKLAKVFIDAATGVYEVADDAKGSNGSKRNTEPFNKLRFTNSKFPSSPLPTNQPGHLLQEEGFQPWEKQMGLEDYGEWDQYNNREGGLRQFAWVKKPRHAGERTHVIISFRGTIRYGSG